VAIAYHLDGLGLFFAGLAAVTSLALFAAWHPAESALAGRSALLAAASLALLLGIVLVGDLIIVYVLWEALGLAGYLAERLDGPLPRPLPGAGRGGGSPFPYAVGHLAGYGLLAAAILLGRASGGGFELGALSPEPWSGVVPGLVLAAALGRLVHAWAGPGAHPGPLGQPTALLLTLSSAYLLLRGLLLAGGFWTPGWGVAVLALGALLAMVGSLRLWGVGLDRLPRQWIWLDVGLLLVAVGIGGASGLVAGVVQVLSLTLARLPVALPAREPGGFPGRPTGDSAIALGLSLGSLAALPPLLGFAARWLLIEAAWERGLWPLVVAVVAAGALGVWAALESAARRGPHREPALAGANGGASPATTGADGGWARHGPLAILSLPILALCLVPALLARLAEPALANVTLDPAGAARMVTVGPTWAALLLALLGPGLGCALHAAQAAGDSRLARWQARLYDSRLWWLAMGAVPNLWAVAESGWSSVVRAASRAAGWAIRLEEGPYAAVALAVVAAMLALLAR